jgi:polyphosphate kinase
MSSAYKYFDRDLSWLSFNYRVLMEARDPKLPLYERLKFLAIFSSNLDEFFRVRVATVRSLLRVKKKQRKALGLEPRKLLDAINEEVGRQQKVLGQIFEQEILPGLEGFNVRLLQGPPEHPEHIRYVDNFFENEVLPNVHPILLRKGKIIHFLRDRALYLAVGLRRKLKLGEGEEVKTRNDYAIVQIPTHYFPRFVMLPMVGEEHTIMFLDDILRYNLHKIFPGYQIKESYSIKLTRDADLQIEDEFSGNLVEKISESLHKRQVGMPSRFLYDPAMPPKMLKYLRGTFDLGKKDLIAGGRYHNFSDFFGFPNPLAPQLERESLPPLRAPRLDAFSNMFEAIRNGNQVLHFPYQSYDYVLSFLNRAAVDPQVTRIKATQYRVAANSAIVSALVRAAQNGKEVTVFVEIKARFDEAANLKSAQEMQNAGVKIIYSFPGLKVHAKVALVEREEDGKPRGYAFLSTGNFNEKTARIYADHGFFTQDPKVTQELNHLFAFLEDRTHTPPPFKHLLVAQFGLREAFLDKLDQEIRYARAGKKARVVIKVNNLEDPLMIDKLYEASQAGVSIDLIIRGICCLRPGVPDMSENITITRIVDQFLEHARVFYFYQDGAEEMFLASSDWMQRNLSRRIELAFPIKSPHIRAEIFHILRLQLHDNSKAVHLNHEMENIPVERQPEQPEVRCQLQTYQLLKEELLGEPDAFLGS